MEMIRWDPLMMSEYIIRYAKEKEATITNLKLQKILYYIQGYSLRVFSSPAFRGDLYCWQYGPVSPMAYSYYSISGSDPLNPNEAIELLNLSEDQENLYRDVIDACLVKTTGTLVGMTHNESPWKKAKEKRGIKGVIPLDDIREYFSEEDPLELRPRRRSLSLARG